MKDSWNITSFPSPEGLPYHHPHKAIAVGYKDMGIFYNLNKIRKRIPGLQESFQRKVGQSEFRLALRSANLILFCVLPFSRAAAVYSKALRFPLKRRPNHSDGTQYHTHITLFI